MKVSLSARCCVKCSTHLVLFSPIKPSPHKNLRKGKLFAPGYSAGEPRSQCANRTPLLSHEMTLGPLEGVGVLSLAPEQRLVVPSGELWRCPNFGDSRR